MVYFKRLITLWSASLKAFKMYYAVRASAPSLHRESTDSLILWSASLKAFKMYYAVRASAPPYIESLPTL